MSFSAADQRAMLAELHRLAAQREADERQIRADFDAATAKAKQQQSDSRQAAIGRFHLDRDSTQREYDEVIARAHSTYDSQHSQAEAEMQQTIEKATGEFSVAQKRSKKKVSEEIWELNTVYEAAQSAPKVQREQDDKQIDALAAGLDKVLRRAVAYLSVSRLRRLAGKDLPEPSIDPTPEQAATGLQTKAQEAVDQLQSLEQLFWPRLLRGGVPFGMAALVAFVFCGVSFWLLGGREDLSWLIVGGVASAAAIIGGGVWIFMRSNAAVSPLWTKLQATLADGLAMVDAAKVFAKRRAEKELQRLAEKNAAELKAAKDKYEAAIAEMTSRRDTIVDAAREKYLRLQAELVQRRDAEIARAEDTYPKRLADIQTRYQNELRAVQERFEQDNAEAKRRYDEAWSAMETAWREGTDRIRAGIEENYQVNELVFPAWSDPKWNDWELRTTPPPAMRFGSIQVDLKDIPGAISATPQLNGMLPGQFSLPALLPFPHNASLLFKASGEGRQRAIEAVQAVMLRMLSTIPPGKLRFTIVDPVGLGENFAGFMHLADYDELLVTNRIWTEPPHIEARLADLTEQMENVIQKYLRNEFNSIDEYNAFAGEVAEPFRVLVVANFPVNFTENAARRLTSIATSGARCGVYTLIVNDVKQPLPARFDIKDLERNAVTLSWSGNKFNWQDADYKKYPLTVESPPPEEQFTKLVHAAGRGAKKAKRVEVPFEYVAPARDAWWTASTAKDVRVPLGRAGATKLQYMKLGEGTSQHVLIAGKTGSGKSTLLHALVTNLALTYSPDQIQLYLIDFKKGVEFKTYATHELPHAHVIAVESEREFGLSVLEKLDAELKARGDLFRKAGVQDLAGYRVAVGEDSMPRIMLIVDEFQELFTDDDKLAQDASLLLDRLVRQGRAFGMHVLLGSQTLGGAYSLARSTIGQMAVRVALQCSEADAYLILSEENSAARLLTRPGEAIYNDANGLPQGNHPFQIVWLGEDRREQYLQDIRQLAEERYTAAGKIRPAPAIVFEGNLPSDLRRNQPLNELLRASDWPVQSTPIHAWLGDAISIKEPTAAVLRPQSGSNLLIVGQREEAVLGMMAAATVSLAAQHRPTTASPSSPAAGSGYAAGSQAKFYVLEHDRPADLPLDRPLADYRSGLAAFASLLPHSIQSAGRRELPQVIAEIAQELARRQETEDPAAPAIYLFISDLGRFRDLRRDESDMGFSFGSDDKPPSPASQFATIVREGPALGIYTIAWCDSLNSVNRVFDRQMLREFSLRILFQMSANDSSHLIDSPLASKLGPNVAIFQNEEEGRLEKFRPYAWPPLNWLTEVQDRFSLRSGAAVKGDNP